MGCPNRKPTPESTLLLKISTAALTAAGSRRHFEQYRAQGKLIDADHFHYEMERDADALAALCREYLAARCIDT